MSKGDHARLSAGVLSAALVLGGHHERDPRNGSHRHGGPRRDVLGGPFTNRDRLGLESTLRRLALQSPVGGREPNAIALVDPQRAATRDML